MFLVVVASMAVAGWALIERSEAAPPDTVRAQVPAVDLLDDDRTPTPTVGAIEGAVPVLAYGPVGDAEGAGVIDPATFAHHLQALDAAGFETVQLPDVAALVDGRSPDLPPHPVLITVDGTHSSAWTTVDPLLAAHDFEAVAFIDPDAVVDNATSARLTWGEVEALKDTGRWAIGVGAHDSFTDDDDGSPESLRDRIGPSLDDKVTELRRRLDRRPTALAYVASGPHATEASFQAGQVARTSVGLVFTEAGDEMASAYRPSSAVPRIAATDLSDRELIRRIADTSPTVPEGLDAPPDPDAAPVVVSLSWDDGRASAYHSLAIQERHGFDATYYINSDQVGSSRYYLSRGQLDELEAAGNEIGGHTEGHVNLTEVATTKARTAICDDRDTLTGWYGPSAGRTFAYPFGSNAKVEDLVDGCGYDAARITSGVAGVGTCVGCPLAETVPPDNRYAIAAPGSVRLDWTLADLQRLVLRAERSGGGWVNYVLHSIASHDDKYGIAPETYDALLAWLAARPNVTVETIGEVMAPSDPGSTSGG